MGKSKKSRNSKKPNSNNATANGANGEGLIMVDPSRVRFQHARIRPVFSGCGRSVEGTLQQIRDGKLSPSDLPPIQVLVGPNDNGGETWYFSLNNRRLWVLKRCREEGLLENNQIAVRVRQPKSESESKRYSVENCALEAKIMPEKAPNNNSNNSTKKGPHFSTEETDDSNEEADIKKDETKTHPETTSPANDDEEDNSSSDDTDDDGIIATPSNNRFRAAQLLMGGDSSSDDDSSDYGDDVPSTTNRFSALGVL